MVGNIGPGPPLESVQDILDLSATLTLLVDKRVVIENVVDSKGSLYMQWASVLSHPGHAVCP